MSAVVAVIIAVVVIIIVLAMALKIVTQYQRGVLFRLGRVIGTREPGLHVILPVIDRLAKVSLRIVTQPIQSQGIITRDNVSVDIAAAQGNSCTDVSDEFFHVLAPLQIRR